MGLFIKGAFKFYQVLKKDYDKKKVIQEKKGFPPNGTISFKDWELFGALLVRDRSKGGNGSDLLEHEIKSAGPGGSFEYQYHKKTGLQKLEEDRKVKHVFISYDNDYKDIKVRLIKPEQTEKIFEGWKEKIIKCYPKGDDSNSKQRCRQRIPHGVVEQQGELLMAIKDGELVYPK